jgi:phosphorylcholine metabolism protein LicD
MESKTKCTSEKLNKTLEKIATILHENNINDWFIGYGTLLGIVRGNSCIENDDDIDIISNLNDYEAIKKALEENHFNFEYGYGIGNSQKILKTKSSEEFASVDLYMAEVTNNGNYNESWEKEIWTKCYVDSSKNFIEKSWKSTVLQLPNKYKDKLKNRYGFFWWVPQNHKLGLLKRIINSLRWNLYNILPESWKSRLLPKKTGWHLL